jgi:hypothetical protein
VMYAQAFAMALDPTDAVSRDTWIKSLQDDNIDKRKGLCQQYAYPTDTPCIHTRMTSSN